LPAFIQLQLKRGYKPEPIDRKGQAKQTALLAAFLFGYAGNKKPPGKAVTIFLLCNVPFPTPALPGSGFAVGAGRSLSAVL